MLKEAMHYTEVADQKLIAIFQQHQHISSKALTLFSHVLNAQHIWANRILGKTPRYAVWEEHETAQFAKISKENFALLGQVFAEVPLDQEIVYRTSKGDEFKDGVKDILFHAFNHSTYHRAQIATLLKQDGIEPPVTDYIILKRNQQL